MRIGNAQRLISIKTQSLNSDLKYSRNQIYIYINFTLMIIDYPSPQDVTLLFTLTFLLDPPTTLITVFFDVKPADLPTLLSADLSRALLQRHQSCPMTCLDFDTQLFKIFEYCA